jgi:hypothetical protein
MSGLAIQGNYSTSPLDYLNGAGASSNQNLQQLMIELLQEILQILNQAQGGDGSGGGSPPVGGVGGGGGGGGGSPFSNLGVSNPAGGAGGGGGGGAPAVTTPGGGTPSTGVPSSGATSATGSASFNAGPNSAIGQWTPDIDKAASLTGLDPNLIGGQMWAESRGNAGSKSTNIDGTSDLSLMQIGQKRWENDVLPTLSAQDKQNIKNATGKDPSQLDMSDPHDNVIGGAYELRMHIHDAGGDVNNPMANPAAVTGGLKAYVGVGNEDQYANNVLTNANVLRNGGKLDDSQ